MPSDAARRGRDLLWYLAAAFLVSEAIVVLAQLARGEFVRLVASGIRITLLIVILRGLLAGHTWARIIMVGLGTLSAVLIALAIGAAWGAAGALPLLALAVSEVLVLSALSVLFLSDDVSAFFSDGESRPVQ